MEKKLFDSPDFPEDVKKRAKIILDGCSGHSLGAYTESNGLKVIRQQVANFIAKRDGIPSNWEDIYLTAGATPAIKRCLSLIK